MGHREEDQVVMPLGQRSYPLRLVLVNPLYFVLRATTLILLLFCMVLLPLPLHLLQRGDCGINVRYMILQVNPSGGK